VPKTDHYADPDAPKANSLVVAVAAVVRNGRGEALLIERTDDGEVHQEFSLYCTARPIAGSLRASSESR
jgi:hypothetical protein